MEHAVSDGGRAMTLSSAPPVRRGSTPVPIKHQLKRESAIVCEDYDWTPGLPGPAPPPISFSSASEESIAPAGRGEAGGEGDGDGLIHILLLGQSGVGKTVLAGALAGGDGRTASVDSETTEGDSYERTVTIDDEEVTIILYDNWKKDLSLLSFDLCFILFSLTDRRSFQRASELRLLVRESRPQTPIILVGNKSDLVRSREVNHEEARSHAALFECRFVEVSAALDHNTSALLEGAVRLLRRSEGAGPGLSPRRRRESLTKKARRFLQSLVPKHYPSGGKFFRQKSRSCHDLTAT
ncbi:GTP-binding protein REM 2 isoform X1 [Acipenser ruthenus]|uniref:GTP-binding protein REM 2 isoform X1 n=2 Tax=Acipenser ruthenus TaxID=7906 RepID=UPI00145B4C15|nr:GTP-binding protein REM 2 isoform X1 [Acipenser ruthenus]